MPPGKTEWGRPEICCIPNLMQQSLEPCGRDQAKGTPKSASPARAGARAQIPRLRGARGSMETRAVGPPASGRGPIVTVKMTPLKFTNSDALMALLTVESLVFAALGVAVSFSMPSNRIPHLSVKVWVLGYLAALFVSIVAFGALMAWWSIFVPHWPSGFRARTVATTLCLAIVGQPGLAWLIAPGLRTKE